MKKKSLQGNDSACSEGAPRNGGKVFQRPVGTKQNPFAEKPEPGDAGDWQEEINRKEQDLTSSAPD